jgi:hypothetical protein
MTKHYIDKDQLRERIVAELNIGHLASDEQEHVINKVSEVLLKKATFEVMRRIPGDVLDELDRLADKEDAEAVRTLVRQHVPDVDDVVARAAKEGLDEHKRLVAELVATQQ